MIEDKIVRLTPDQQREVEDFIDFLITRDAALHTPNDRERSGNLTEIRGDVLKQTPMIFADERPVAGRLDQDILPDYPEYGGSEPVEKQSMSGRRIVIPRRQEKEPGKLLDWID